MWMWLRTLGSRARASVRRTPFDRALDAEVQEHLGLLEQRFRDRGMTDDEARHAARRAFGSVDRLRESHREARAFMGLDRSVQDVAYAVRMLRRRPAFAAVCIVTLALGIGANTAVFTVINGLLLRPLPYPQADRLIRIGWDWDGSGQATDALASLKFDYLRRYARAFAALATWRSEALDLGPRGEDGLVHALRVSEDFFDVVGFHPRVGRTFTGDEQTPGGPAAAILSDAMWRTRFGADPAVIGKRLTLDDRDYSIVGLMPPGFEFPEEPSRVDVILALQFRPNALHLGANYPALGRLAPGVDDDAAMRDVHRVMDRVRVEQPDQFTATSEGALQVEIGKLDLSGFQNSLWMLLAAVGLVLLIACANVAGLVLARTSERGRELALRAALGASRGRIVRQVVTESLVLGLAGGLAGLAVGLLGVQMLIGLAPADVPRLDWIAVDGRVLAFTAVVAALTGLVFGVAAALPSAGPRLTNQLKAGLPGAGIGRGRTRQRSLLVGAEVALTTVLLAAAGLLTSSLIRLHRTELGFDPNGVLTMSFRRIPEAYRNAAYAADFEQRLTQRLDAMPGVLAVASTTIAPLGPRGRNIPMTVNGRPDATEGAVEWRAVSRGYFSLLGLPLVRGRSFTADDVASAAPVAVINESLARRYWPEGDALGQRIRLGVFRGEVRSEEVMSELSIADPAWQVSPIPREIVGIVADARELGPTTAPRRTVFLPAGDRPGLPVFLIRGDRQLPVEALRAVVRDVDPELPTPQLATLGERLGDLVAGTRFTMVLLTLFAGVALALTAVGIYGLVSWAVRSRTTEIGIRIALGANRRLVLGRVAAGGMLPVLAGLGVGAAGAVPGTRALQSLLHGVGPADPLTIGAAAVALSAVALLAAGLPAQRAARIDPATVLRSE